MPPAKKKTGTKKTSRAKTTKKAIKARNQINAIVMFAVGVLLICLAIIKGESMWNVLHNFVYGIFGGVGAFLWPLLLMYIAAVISFENSEKVSAVKAWQAGAVIFFLVVTIGVFTTVPQAREAGKGFFASFPFAYGTGKSIAGSGAISMLIAYPLVAALGASGSKIVICIVLFIAVMVMTGTTIAHLVRGVAKPVKAIETKTEEVFTARKIQRDEKAAKLAEDKKFNIDLDIDDMPIEKGRGMPPKTEKWDDIEREVEAGESNKKLEELKRVAEDTLGTRSLGMDKNADIENIIAAKSNLPRATGRLPLDNTGNQSESLGAESIPNIASASSMAGSNSVINTAIKSNNGQASDFSHNIFQDDAKHEMAKTTPESDISDVPPVEVDLPKLETVDGSTLASEIIQQKLYQYPPVSLLDDIVKSNNRDIADELQQNANLLVDTLKSFGVETRVIAVSRGPSVTRYELQPSAGVKISRITNLADDIALNLAASGVRIEAPIPNKAAVGIEVPNKITSIVKIKELLNNSQFDKSKSKLTVALGKDIAGQVCYADLSKMPHLLIAGATGSGKSVCINTMILSLLYKANPDEVKLLMIDPKVVELGIYNGIPHLLAPVVNSPKEAAGTLDWAVSEMLKRYKLFAENNVRDMSGYNELCKIEGEEQKKLPQIVIIIDELADLMMAAPKEVEESICRLAQMARAAGMHLVIATQRPSVDVITGIIKANVPSRLSFAVSSQVDSRTILDSAGAEKLLGRGDMLFAPVGAPKPTRIQGCFVTDKEVERVVKFIKDNKYDIGGYDEEVVEEIKKRAVETKTGKSEIVSTGGQEDELMPKAIECVIAAGNASTSLLQRRLSVGHARAGRLMDTMEEMGIVGEYEGSKPRKVLITMEQFQEMQFNKQS